MSITTPQPLRTIQTKNVDDAAIRVVLEDSDSCYSLGPAIRVDGVQESAIEFEFDTAENKTEGWICGLYGRIVRGSSSLTIGKFPLPALSAILGTKIVENADQGVWIRFDRVSQLPYLQAEYVSKYVADLDGRARVRVVINKIKCSALSFSIGQDNFATVSIEFSALYTAYPVGGSGELLSIGGELSTEGIADAVTYLPHSQSLPLWAPDESQGFTGRTADPDLVQQRAYKSSVPGDFLEWRRSFGAGQNVLNVLARTGPDRGRLRVFLDGEPVGSVDLYSSAPDENQLIQLATTVAESGPKVLRLEVVDRNSESSGDLVELSDVWSLNLSSFAVTSVNTWPAPVQVASHLPAFQYSAASGSPEVITSATNAGEKLEFSGLGEWLEYETALSAGTYSIRAVIGRGADYGSISFSVGGSFVGELDCYAASTQTPDVEKVPGSFVVSSPGFVKIRASIASKNAASTGSRAVLAWLGLTQEQPGDGLSESALPSALELYPWQASEFVGWSGSASSGLRNWETVSDGAAGRELVWPGQIIPAGTVKARLAATVEPGGPLLEVWHAGSKLATLNLDGDSGASSRVEAVFDVPATRLGDLVLKNPSATPATINYLFLQATSRSEGLGQIHLNDAAEHHLPRHRAGDVWPGLSYVFTINGSPADFTGAEVRWRVYAGSLSGAVVVELTEAAGLTVSGDTVTVNAQTPSLGPGLYSYDLQVDGVTRTYGTWEVV